MNHLIWSPEEFLARERSSEIVGRLADPEIVTLYAEGAGVPGLEEALFTGSLFGNERCVVVREAERLTAAGAKVLGALLAGEHPGTTLVLVAVAERQPATLLRNVEELVKVHRLPRPRRGDLPGWVASRLKNAGVIPGRGTANALVDAVGSDLRELVQGIDQLVTRAGRGGRIEPEHVSVHFPGTAEQPIWRLFDAIVAQDRARALRILEQLLAQGEEPMAVAFAVVSQVRLAMRARSLAEREPGLREDALARELGVSAGRAAVARRQAAELGWARLIALHELLAEADVELKGGEEGTGLPPPIVLARFVDAASAATDRVSS